MPLVRPWRVGGTRAHSKPVSEPSEQSDDIPSRRIAGRVDEHRWPEAACGGPWSRCSCVCGRRGGGTRGADPPVDDGPGASCGGTRGQLACRTDALALGARSRTRCAAGGRSAGLVMNLRIAITADPYLPVPPRLYGGIERVVALLVAGLVRKGHEVTLIAHPDSRTPASLIGYGVPPHTGTAARVRELIQVGSALVRLSATVDVIHSFGRLAALVPVLPMRGVKKIQSYQRPIPWTGVRRAAALGGDSILFTGCSTSLYAPANGAAAGTRWRTVFNCVDPSAYVPVMRVQADAPLAFLGRIERIKGTHHAVHIAKAAGRRLVIAGNVADQDYFRAEVAPHIDSRLVRYVGEVDDAAKNRLLGAAAALLMPIEWDEPFGIVMAEAFACGTPVIGFSRGSVPEVVRDGVNGFLARGVAEATQAVARLDRINRGAVRRDCEQRFSSDAIVAAYEDIYREAVG